MTEDGDIPEGDDLLAAEYVLGLLTEEENAELEARLDLDGALRARVVFWHEHYASMTDAIPEVAPPAQVWRRIESAVYQPERSLGAARPTQPTRPVRAPRPVRLNLWRGLAGLATAAVVALAAFIFVAPEQPEAPLFAGEVRAEDASQRFVVTYDPDSGTVRLARAAGGAAPARSLELWAIYEGEDPVSLAVLPQDERFQFVVPEPMRQRFAEATLAISEEPEGGAPGGLPTGPIVAVGGITRL